MEETIDLSKLFAILKKNMKYLIRHCTLTKGAQ